MDCSPPGSYVHGILQARILEWVAHSLLQRNFLTQGSNPGLLHHRQILYHLSYREVSGVPIISNTAVIGLAGYTLLKTLLAYYGSECSKV